jgi:hypothetical protein
MQLAESLAFYHQVWASVLPASLDDAFIKLSQCSI